LRAALQTLREAIQPRRPYLLGLFSYADIVMASSLQAISPVADEYLRLGPATRRVWTCEPLASEFSDLCAWRDEIYAKHRNRTKSP